MTVIVWDGRTLAVDRMAQCGDLKQVVCGFGCNKVNISWNMFNIETVED